KPLRRIILDSDGRTPLNAQVASDPFAAFTTVVVTKAAPKKRVAALAKRVNVWVGPKQRGRINLYWLLERLGAEEVTSLLVEGAVSCRGTWRLLLLQLGHQLLGLANIQIIFNDSLGRQVLFGGCGQPENYFCVPDREAIRPHIILDCGRKFEQAE